MMREVSIALSNLALTSGQSRAISGAEEPLDAATSECAAVRSMGPRDLVRAMDASPHFAQLHVAVCEALARALSADAAAENPTDAAAATAEAIIEAGLLPSASRALARHAGCAPVLLALLPLLVTIFGEVRPASALFAEAGGVGPLIAALKETDSAVADAETRALQLAAARALHALAATQTLGEFGESNRRGPARLTLADAAAALLGAEAVADEFDGVATGAHCRAALSWLCTDAAAVGEFLGGPGADRRAALDRAMAEPLCADGALRTAPLRALAGVMIGAPAHYRFQLDVADEMVRRLKAQDVSAAELMEIDGFVRHVLGGFSVPEIADVAEDGWAGAVGSGAQLVSTICDDDDGLEAMLDHGVVSCLLGPLSAPTPPPRALRYGCEVLSRALGHCRAPSRLAARGGSATAEEERAALLGAAMHVLPRVLEQAGHDEATLECALGALASLSCHVDGLVAMAAEGLLRRVVGLVESRPTDTWNVTAAADCADLLRRLGEYSAEVFAEFAEAVLKWIEAVTARAPSAADESPLPLAAARLMRLLLGISTATGGGDGDSDGGDGGGNSGEAGCATLRALIALLKGHRPDGAVQAVGCDALAGYAATDAPALAQYGGVKTLLFAMRGHIRDIDVQAPAVRGLRHVAAAEKCRTLVVSANGVPMIAASLRRHDNDASLQADGAAALSSLLETDAGVSALRGASDGIEVLVHAMRHVAGETLASAVVGLRRVVEGEPALRARAERANGRKFLE